MSAVAEIRHEIGTRRDLPGRHAVREGAVRPLRGAWTDLSARGARR